MSCEILDFNWKPLRFYESTLTIGENQNDNLIEILTNHGFYGLSNLTSDVSIANTIETILKCNQRRFKNCKIFYVLKILFDCYKHIKHTGASCKDELMEVRDLLNGIDTKEMTIVNLKFRTILSQTFDVGESAVIDHLKAWTYHLLSLCFRSLKKHDREYEYFIGSLKLRLRHYLYRDKFEIAFKLLERAFLDLYEYDNCSVIRSLKVLKQDHSMIETASTILGEEINKNTPQYIKCQKFYYFVYVHYIGRLFDLSAYFIAWKKRHGKRPVYFVSNFYCKLGIDLLEKEYTVPDHPLELDYQIKELHEHLVCLKTEIEAKYSLEIDNRINTLTCIEAILTFSSENFSIPRS